MRSTGQWRPEARRTHRRAGRGTAASAARIIAVVRHCDRIQRGTGVLRGAQRVGDRALHVLDRAVALEIRHEVLLDVGVLLDDDRWSNVTRSRSGWVGAGGAFGWSAAHTGEADL